MATITLRQLIAKHFSIEEVRTICFDLSVDYDSLPGEEKSAKIRELIDYLRRRGRINELVAYLSHNRPDVNWNNDISANSNAKSHLSFSSNERVASQIPRTPHDGRLSLLPRRQNFIGRAKDLELVLTSLKHPRSWLTSLEGIPGIGKTSLAVEAAYVALEQGIFEEVVYITAQNYDFLLRDLIDVIARSLTRIESNEFQQDISLAYRLLSQKRTLLIIDNFETLSREYSSICSFLRDMPAPSKALLTSRRLERLEVTHISLQDMNPVDSAIFIAYEWSKLFNSTRPVTNYRDLGTATGGNPHFMKLALSQLRKGVHFHRVLELLDKATGEPYEFYDNIWDNHIKSDEQLVLVAMPLFAAPPSWNSLLETTGLSDERFETAIGHLSELLLIEPGEDSGTGDRKYHAHPLTINYGRRRLNDNSPEDRERKKRLQQRFVEHFLDLAERYGNRSWKEYHILEEEQKNIFSAMQYLADIEDWKGLMNIAMRIRHFVIRQDRSRLIPYNRLGDYFPQAVDICERGIEAAAKSGDVKSECRLLIELGNIEMIRGDIETARGHLADCLAKSKLIDFSTREIMALRRLGHIEARRGNIPGAEELYLESLKIARQVDDHTGISRALRALGDLYYERGNMEKALDYYENSMAAVTLDIDSIGIPRVVRRVGNIYYQNGDLSLARDYFRRCVDLYTGKYDISGTCYSFYGLGKINMDTGNLNRSLTCSLGGIRILGCINDGAWPNMRQKLTEMTVNDFPGLEPRLDTYIPTIDKTMQLCLFQLLQIRERLGFAEFDVFAQKLIDKWDLSEQKWLEVVKIILEDLAAQEG